MRGVRLRLEYRNAGSLTYIVDYIPSDPEAAVGQSIHKLAAQTYTPASTVVRSLQEAWLQAVIKSSNRHLFMSWPSNKSNDIAALAALSVWHH